MTEATTTTKKSKSKLPADMVMMESTAGRAKSMRDAQAKAVNRQQIAIDMAITFLGKDLSLVFSVLMEEAARHCDVVMADALNLIEMGQEKIGAMRAKHYQDYDDCVSDFAQIGSLMRSLSRVYGDRDDAITTTLKGCEPDADVMLALIEQEEVLA